MMREPAPLPASMDVDAAMVRRTTAACWPWNLSTVPTRTSAWPARSSTCRTAWSSTCRTIRTWAL
ncbi:hypothetical protein E8P82_07285 [Arthrobacter echini]|uniref:Uncharacterized protein n=1 Tax=Arthrobacter echini TaxID=1529066 RepID=A0A4S5E5B9_9MICC|nr:hypothetical protein [Arthrobacter echini]THJ66736.1 hypothetical protein E8P82_07285 [Arthrobacter echini]